MKNKNKNKWCWANWVAIDKRMKVDHYLTLHTKINSKWFEDLACKSQNYKNCLKKPSPWIWQWFLIYDTKITRSRKKE